MWRCNQCPAGQPHVWVTSVAHRTNGSKCPYCQGKKICMHNALATVAPAVAKYWNYDLNDKTPEETLAGSGARAEWKCPNCSYEWKAAINQRVVLIAGCPKCSTGSLRKLKNQKHPTFDEAQHHLLSEWDYEHNAEDGIYPDTTSLASNKLVHWICRKCPQGRLHQWCAPPCRRTGQKPMGCPMCAGRQVCICNSLETVYPTIAAELDLSKNDFTAGDVTASSSRVSWWTNENRGSWKQTINARTSNVRRRGRS